MIRQYKILQITLLFLLVLQIAMLPVQSLAGRKLASVRTGRLKQDHTRFPSDRELMNALRQASLEAIGRVFLLYDSPEDLRQLLLSSLSVKDREEMRPLIKEGVPKFSPRINGDALELTAAEGEFVIRWPQFPLSIFNINGVDWTVSSHQSLRFNVDHLVQLQLRYGKKSALIRLFMEEASANVSAGLALAIAFLGAVMGAVATETIRWGRDILLDSYCTANIHKDEMTRASCITTLEKLAKAKDYYNQLTGIKAEVAVKKTSDSGNGTTEEQTRWLPGTVKSCPSALKQNIYISDIIMTKVQKGKAQKLGDWQTVKFEIEPGSKKIKSGIVVPRGTDLSSTNVLDSAKATFEFDENGLKTIRVPNPQRENLESPPMVPINMARDLAALQPWELAEKTKWVDMLSQVIVLINACILAETQAEVNAQEAKPAAPLKLGDRPALPTGLVPKDGAQTESIAPTVR